MTKLEKNIYECLEPIINNIGYDLYDVIYEKIGSEYHLSIFIDNFQGITIEDCEKVNSEINEILDKEDFIKDQYYLEVSSPGLERNIRLEKHFKQYINSMVRISLYKSIDKNKEFIGKLISFDENNIKIMVDTNEISIDRKSVAKITTYYDFSLNLGGDN